MRRRRKDLLTFLLDVTGDAPTPNWHASLAAAVEGMDASQARWSPGTGRPSAWALLRHATHWKTAVTTALDHGELDTEAWDAEDWGPEPADDAAWDADREAFATVSRRLRQRIGAADDGLLDGEAAGFRGTIAELVAQVAAHDAYHAGQVRLLAELYAARGEGA